VQLIGMLDSPYVRRVAISLRLLQVPFEHRSISVFSDFDQFAQINPVVKAPTLVCSDGEVLMDSTLIGLGAKIFELLVLCRLMLARPPLDMPAFAGPTGLLGVHSCYGLRTRQVTLSDPLHQRLQLIRFLHRCSDYYRPERQFAGWDSYPREDRAFARRTVTTSYQSRWSAPSSLLSIRCINVA
jgi:hypothetical protein